MQLILSQFKNSLRPAYTNFHTAPAILIDCTTHAAKKGVGMWGWGGGNRHRVSVASVTKAVFPLCSSCEQHSLLSSPQASDIHTRVRTDTHKQSRCHVMRSGPADWLWFSPPLSSPALPLSHRLFARHLIFLFNNQPWKCVGRKMAKYRRSHNSSHNTSAWQTPP